jgi:hypothetical protein
MFYSRPHVEPFGWDLRDLPTPNGPKHFDALTSDGRPVDFRFSGGWLMVELGPVNAPLDGPHMEEVLAIPISPFGTMDIEPEQLCDILGLTVNGQKIDSAGIRTRARGFDWSGRTTYWESAHLMLPDDDARVFVQKLCDAFPGSFLVQPEWGSHGRCRCRQIKFPMASDEVVALGIGPDDALFHKMLAGGRISWEEFDSVFAYRIDFIRADGFFADVTGSRYIHSSGAAELGLNYSVIQHRRYRIRVEYLTEDAAAQACTKTLLSLIDASFCHGLQVVNLQTGAVITESLRDDTDEKSYSIALRDEWLERPNRYLFVGKTVLGGDIGGGEGESGVFYGARPIQGVLRSIAAGEASFLGVNQR